MIGQRRPNIAAQRADPTRGSLACACVLLVLLTTSARVEASEQEASARKAYTAGVAAFQNGDNAAAYDHFALANQTFPSPNIKLMLGRTLARLGRRGEAYRVLNEALAVAGDAARYETTARAARDELRELEKQLAIVRIRVDDPDATASLRIDDQVIERALWSEPLALEPGTVHVELADPNGRRDGHQLELSAGSSVTLAMRIPDHVPARAPAPTPVRTIAAASEEPASTGSHQLRPVSYAVAGLGLAGLAAFAILGSLSESEFSKLEDACPNAMRCDARHRETATRGQTYQTVANVSLGVGSAALATGLVLWLVSAPREREPEQTSRLDITPHSLQWSGSF